MKKISNSESGLAPGNWGGKSLRAVCIEARIPANTLYRRPQVSPRIDVLERLAAALEWSLADIIGFDETAHALTIAANRIVDGSSDNFLSSPVDPDLLWRAYLLAQRSSVYMSSLPMRMRTISAAHETARIYKELAERQHGGLPLDKEFLARFVGERWTRQQRRRVDLMARQREGRRR